MAHLRPTDYAFRRIAGVEVEPPPRTWSEAIGLWLMVVLVTIAPDWLLDRLFGKES